TPTLLTYIFSLHDALPILPRIAIVDPHPAALADGDHDVALDALRHVRVNTFHVTRIGIDHRADQRFVVVDVHVPAIAGQMLVVRSEEHTSELQSRENIVCR